MRDRRGIVFVAFDLPTETADAKLEYRKFRSYLIKNGYIMFQKSLYYKIIGNTLYTSKEIHKVALNSPKKGDIVALPLTLNEMYKIETINSSKFNLDEIKEDVYFY